MSTVIEEFVAKLGWDVDSKALTRFQSQVQGFRNTARTAFVAVTAGTTLLSLGLRRVMQSFSMVEDAQASFTPLLGGAQRAKEMVDALNAAAAATPFEFQNLSRAAEQLLPVMNGQIGQTIDFVKMLGDTAGGNAQRLDSVVRGFSRVAIKGKASMESLNIIAEAGIPIYAQLQKSLGLTNGDQMLERLRQGKISMDDLTKTFKDMTSAGGIYFKGMEIASKTFSGRMSTFRDEVNLTLAQFGTAIAPMVKDLLEGAIKWVQELRAWATANQHLIRTEFKKYLKDLVGLFESLVGMVKGVKSLTDAVGGLGNAVKLLVGGYATVKLTATIASLSALTKAAPAAGGALTAAASGAPLLAWGAVGAAIGASLLIIDDVKTSLEGGDGFFRRNMINPLLEATKGWKDLTNAEKEAREQQMLAFAGLDKGLGHWFQTVFGRAYDAVEDFGMSIQKIADVVANAILFPINLLWRGIYEAIGGIRDMFQALPERFKSFREGLRERLGLSKPKSEDRAAVGASAFRSLTSGVPAQDRRGALYLTAGTAAQTAAAAERRAARASERNRSFSVGGMTVNVIAPAGANAREFGNIVGKAAHNAIRDFMKRAETDMVTE